MNFKRHRSVFRFKLLWLFLFASPLFGCSGPEKISFEKKDIVFLSAGSEIRVKAEIAENDEQRARGLMFRKKLADGEGMIFIFERDQMMSFWMQNTLVPLSIAYIASDGIILEIHDMRPFDISSVASARPARYAVEVPQGWFGRAGIKIGDRLVTENL